MLIIFFGVDLDDVWLFGVDLGSFTLVVSVGLSLGEFQKFPSEQRNFGAVHLSVGFF